MSHTIRYTALLKIEVELDATTANIAGELRAIRDNYEAADAVTVMGVLERRCAGCGSPVPGRCFCSANAALSDNEDALELDNLRRSREAGTRCA